MVVEVEPAIRLHMIPVVILHSSVYGLFLPVF